MNEADQMAVSACRRDARPCGMKANAHCRDGEQITPITQPQRLSAPPAEGWLVVRRQPLSPLNVVPVNRADADEVTYPAHVIPRYRLNVR